MNEEEEIIEVNNVNYSLRKILGSGFNAYAKADNEIKTLVKLKITVDLYQMEKGFTELNKYFNKEISKEEFEK